MKHFRTASKVFIIFITLLAVYLLYWLYIFLYPVQIIIDKKKYRTRDNITCYDTPDTSNITSSKYLQSFDLTIFFLETSCKGGLNTRQACSVESAARANPQWQIIVLVPGPLSASFLSAKSYLNLSSLGNIKFLRLNVTDFSKRTPIESLFSKNALSESSFPIVHASDILRLLTLHQFGGVYLDLDVIVVKSFDTLPKNFVTKETDFSLSNGIFALTNDGIGKMFTDMALRDLAVSFNPGAFSGNGPVVLMRTLNKICKQMCKTRKQKYNIHMSADTCGGVTIFDSKYFYPIPYTSWRDYYNKQQRKTKINSSHLYPQTYTHHVWNALGYKKRIPKKSLFAGLASTYCPSVYESYRNRFGSLGY